MPCRFYKTDNGGIMFVCANDESAFDPEVCYICGKPATCVCDYSDGLVLSICDKPMCEEHSYTVALDTHVCGKHFNEVNIRKAKKIRDILADKFEWEYPKENMDGDGI